MALSVEELEKLRDNLVRARASGVRVSRYDDKQVTYATDAEMVAAIADLDRQLAKMTQPRRSGAVAFNTSKGI
ncbi:hypothetical protein [Hoeflea sp.]|jgi:hypothetical protein|uniref:phage head-tail joining protein n=1 Tax=Hoeflea sp. TaxID=1940281 RepID=UPI0019C27A1E|nr:hypothetical protein [Hoeflea sp.]MBC7286007.1 hypothetical protein [Hoeflea sp.]